MTGRRRALGLALAVVVVGAPLVACGGTSGKPTCSANQVAEFDDDGWECEPDVNGNGRDDEDERRSGIVVVPRVTANRSQPATTNRRPATPRPVRTSPRR